MPRSRMVAARASNSSVGADLRVQLRVVADVVAVLAARARPEERRGVAIADAEFAQVVDQRLRVPEGEMAVEL